MTSTVKRYILLGDSGAGKSSLINFLYNYCYGTKNPDEVFNETQQNVVIAIPCQHWEDRVKSELKEKSTERDVTDRTQSQTMECSLYPLHFEHHHITIELIDTPGFNDSHGVGQDDAILHKIKLVLQSIPYLSGLIIVANGSQGRLGTSFQHSMHQLQQVLPDSLRANVCAVLTNSDATSCNLSLDIFRGLFHDIKVFHIQNSLFRWNRTHRGSSNPIMANLRRYFKENLDEVDKLVGELEKFENISTIDVIKSGEKQTRIQECINESLQKILGLIQLRRQQSITSHALQGAHMTMAANQTQTKQETITAFKWMEVEPESSSVDTSHPTQTSKEKTATSPTGPPPPAARDQFETSSRSEKSAPNQSSSTSPNAFHRQHSHTGETPAPTRMYQRVEEQLRVTLKDNEAISHYETARQQADSLQRTGNELTEEHKQLIGSMNALLTTLEDNVRQILEINRDIDLLEQSKSQLTNIKDEIKQLDGDESSMTDFYNKLVCIMSKPTTTASQMDS